MRNVIISTEARNALREKAEWEWHETGTRQDDGTWLIPLSLETIEGLEAIQLDGESLSDTILRLISGKTN